MRTSRTCPPAFLQNWDPHVVTKPLMSRGFDLYCWLEEDMITEKADKKKRFKKYANYTNKNLFRLVAAAEWQKVGKTEKRAYAQRAFERHSRGRGDDGKFLCADVEVDADAEAVVDGESADEEVPAICESADEEAADMVTPNKKKKRWGEVAAQSQVYEAVVNAMQDEETPQKEKSAINAVLGRISDKSTKMKKVVRAVCGPAYRQRSGKKLGRPHGAVAVSDAMLVNSLDEHTTDSSLMHIALERPIKTLQQSKRRTAKATKLLKKTQFCKRLRLCRLGVAPATTQRGKCDACEAWTHGGRKQVAAAIAEGRTLLQCKVPGYWKSFDLEYAIEDEYELSPADSPEYQEALKNFVHSHYLEQAALRAHLEVEEAVEVTTIEHDLCARLCEYEEDVKNWSWHLALRRSVEAAWRSSWYHPAEPTAYLLWDHMAPIS